jgi:exosortase
MSTATPTATPKTAASRRSADRISALLPGLIAIAAVPGLVAYYWRLWTLPHYQFFPVAFVGAWLLAKSPRRVDEPAPHVSHRVRRVLFATGLSILFVSVGLDIPWLCLVASLVSAVAWLYEQGGKLGVARNVPALIMVATTLRVPLNFDRWLMTNMQNLTTRMAGAVLDIVHITHATLGNIIDLPGKSLFVEEACSGVNSLFSVSACTIFYLLRTKRSPFVWFVLLTSVPLWTLTANVGRVVTVVVLYSAWGIEADVGWLHDALGLASFASAVILVYCTDRLLKFYAAVLPPELPVESPLADREDAAEAAASRLSDDRSIAKPAFARFATIAASLLILWQIPLSIDRLRDYTENLRGLNPPELGADYLAAKHGPWTRREFEFAHRAAGSNFGGHSQIWKFSGNERTIVSFDYPFTGWHELSECYAAQGWGIESREVMKPLAGRPGYVVMSMNHRPTGRYGRVWFALFDKAGGYITSTPTDRFEQWQARLMSRLSDLSFWGPKEDPDRASFQTQVFVEAYAPLSTTADQEGRALFFDALSKLTSDPEVVRSASQ